MGILYAKEGLTTISLGWSTRFLIFLVIGGSSPARAVGTVSFEASSFLKTSTDRGTLSTTLVLGPDLHGEGEVFGGELEPRGYFFLENRSSFTLEARNAYLATSRKLMPRHQLTVGRREYSWSVADSHWKSGLWNPRFLWDPLKPEEVGLTGFFYVFESRKWRLQAYASPVSIPERGYPVTQDNGRLSAGSPFFIAPPDTLLMEGVEGSIPVRYSVSLPDTEALILRSAAATSLRYGESKGVWAQAAYGYMPIHQADIAAESHLNLLDFAIDTTLHARFGRHHLGALEAGYQTHAWSVWSSIQREVPLPYANEPSWVVEPIGATTLLSMGGDLRWFEGLSLNASFWLLQQQKGGITNSDALAIDADLPTRFPYNRAWKVGGKWQGQSPVTYLVTWTYDTEFVSNLLSVDLRFLPGWNTWNSNDRRGLTIGLGADLISTATGEGWIGKYEGNDRVRGGLSYAF